MSEVFDEYCTNFHQDIFVIYDSLEAAIAGNVSELQLTSLKTLEAHLQDILTCEGVNLKALCHKAGTNILFRNTKSARYFLEQSHLAVRNRLQKLHEEKINLYSRD